MVRFFFAAFAYATRSLLATTIAVLAISGAVFLGVYPLSAHPHPSRSCRTNYVPACNYFGSSRDAWQIPVAAAIVVVGVGLAGFLAHWRRPPQPLPPLPAQWQ